MKQINIRVELERQEHLDFSQWAEEEGRSKRRHAAVIFRKLNALRRTQPDELAKLGLLERHAPSANH